MALSSINRISLSVAVMPLAEALGWSTAMQGSVQAAFLYGYMATQLAGGWAADRFGGKAVLECGVAVFSLASALLPPAAGSGALPAVLTSRVLLGLGAGLAMPAVQSLAQGGGAGAARRGAALAVMYLGSHVGNLVGLAATPVLVAAHGWPMPFLVFGGLGIPVLMVCHWLIPPKATTGPSAKAKEQAGAQAALHASSLSSPPHHRETWHAIVTNRSVWAIAAATTVNHWGYFIYLTWMPTYFHTALGMDMAHSAAAAALPWAAMALGSATAAGAAEALLALGWPLRRVRCGIQAVAFLVPLAALMTLAAAGPRLPPTAAVALVTLALGITSLGQAGFVAAVGDVAPGMPGRVFGLCSTLGCVAGIAGVQAAGCLLGATGNFAALFAVTGGLYIAGTLVFTLLLDTRPQIL